MKVFIILAIICLIVNALDAVNVSNTWTMPQEGLNVFYRFFRDRISWFEADAVCQFHHANLVTVDNSFQFDATRDLLRELDVNDIVWIGLMRPQSSDRFMWSNSRPLVSDTGYWAESLPLMDAPLCAVIDPIRDYRWHALRCGGPETASFLCEMPVPSWADACNLKDMPNLTLQYMADTASIELIRNCQEEGLLRTMCRGKQDRERALQELICPRERLEAQRINDITNSHFKSLQIINSIPSDNNENNDIELLPMEVNYGQHYPEELQTEKNTVQRLIEQFNVDELMQADEPSNMETVSSFYKIPGLIPTPVKKSAKKVLDSPKKDNVKQKGNAMSVEQTQKDRKRLPVEMEEMMMGDQPLRGEPKMPEQFLNEEVSNEILEPLPHIKKTNMQREDSLEKMEKEAIAIKKNMQKSKEMENKKMLLMSTTTMTAITTTSRGISTAASTTERPLTTTLDKADGVSRQSADNTHRTHYEFDNTWSHLATTTSPVTIGHPIHPQQPHGNVINAEGQHPHVKEATDNSHFIPPMLMVKSHYIPSASKHGHSEYDHHQHHHQEQQQKHPEHQLHFEMTTEAPAETTVKHEQNKTSDATTLELLNSSKTTLKISGTSLSSAEDKKQVVSNKQEPYQVALITTTEKDNSMKPITEQQTTEDELPKNYRNLQYEETSTTMTATTLPSVAGAVEEAEGLSRTSNSEEINKNNNANKEKDKKYTQDLKSPQTSHTDAETTEATKYATTTEKSLKSTQKLYDLETATENTERITEIADATAIEATISTQQQEQQHVPTMEEKLTAIKIQKNKEHSQTKTATTEEQKPAAAQTTEVLPTSTTVSQPVTQQTPIAIKTETAQVTQSLQQTEKEQKNKEELEEDREEGQDNKETIVKTTEILQTSTAFAIAQQEKEKEDDAPVTETATTTTKALTPTTSTSITTTTTVKPITTTLPQNEVKSTETSVSSTSSITTTKPTTTNIPITIEDDDTSTTTTKPPTSTTAAPMLLPSSTTTTTTTIVTTTTTEAEVATSRAETTTKTPAAAPETTRNFLKVTTEIPFKPNRRRTLTKPETVSYMKKILG